MASVNRATEWAMTWTWTLPKERWGWWQWCSKCWWYSSNSSSNRQESIL